MDLFIKYYKKNMNTYLFIVEVSSDVKEIKKLMKADAVIRKTRKLIGDYIEEFDCVCGYPIYKMKTDLNLDIVKNILKNGSDLHYVCNSINTENDFTGYYIG
jgi:hypothetical protein